MPSLPTLLLSLTLAWPVPPATDAQRGEATGAPAAASQAPAQASAAAGDPIAIWQEMARAFRESGAAQVRIEQRIIMRISPMPGPARENLTALAPMTAAPPRMIERAMGDCIPMSGIAGGQPQRGSRLLLFLRDRRLVAADLEKGCSARDFYSGFYVEKPNADGRLCAARDRVLARSGARCQIASFRQLMPGD